MGGNDNGSKGGGNSKGNRDSYFIHDDNGTIDYRGSWVMNTFPLPTSSKQQTSQNTADRNAGMFVSFIGSQIQVLGMIQPGEDVIRANYSIDGGNPTTRRVPGLSQNVPLYNQTLYTSPNLDDGYHNLTVQMAEIGNGRNYSFQMFNVLKAGEQNISHVVSAGGVHYGNSMTTLVVGAVLGSVVFLLLAFQAVFYLWRRRRIMQTSIHDHSRSPFDGTQRTASVSRRASRDRPESHLGSSASYRSDWTVPAIDPLVLPSQGPRTAFEAANASRPLTINSSSSAPPAYATVDARSESLAMTGASPSNAGTSYGTSRKPQRGTSISENSFVDNPKSPMSSKLTFNSPRLRG
ncbi:hypothetical protein ACEPAF_1256 [Sanghuangporus sanghuang]